MISPSMFLADAAAAPPAAPMITNDAVVLGLLMVILGFVFWTSNRPGGFWKRFYRYVPSLLMCYFLPSLLSTAGVISGEHSKLYFVSTRYLLPTSKNCRIALPSKAPRTFRI